MPLWRERSIRGVGYHSHLYTRIREGAESDDFEQWLNAEFETPAEPVLAKAVSDSRLSKAEWTILVRFLAAQDVRTPARFAESIPEWHRVLPGILNDSLQEAVEKVKAAKVKGQAIEAKQAEFSEYLPIGLKREILPELQEMKITAQIVAGRSLWLYQMKRLLTHTLDRLLDQKWSILRAPEGISWFTSDNPVLKLNWQNQNRYDFKGGWGSQGTEIILPLDSKHLLYSKVGHPRPKRGSLIDKQRADMLRRLIAEHAYRYIFSESTISDVTLLRGRTVDLGRLRYESEQWYKWNQTQTIAEQKMHALTAPRRRTNS